jgi:hypothetical protein
LALAFFGVPFLEPERPEPTVIPVEIVTEAQLADITTPKPAEPEPAPEKPKEAEEPPPPEPEPKPAPPPPPPPPAEEAEAVPPLEEIKPEPKPRLEEKPVPKPEPRPTASISPRTKPKAPKRFDTSQIAALLDKKEEPKPQPKAEDKKLDLDKLAKELNTSTPASKQQLATLQAMIQSQIFNCWNIPAGVKNAQNQLVRVRILLRPDGSLIGAPEVLNKERYNDPDGAQFDVAARAAVNAIYRCTPLKLPRERYDDWREVIQNFDPSQMLDVN